MAGITPATPVVGAPMTGLTSPTYTVTSDQAPSQNAKQYAVTTLGGTQTGVTVSSVDKPFTGTVFRPAVFQKLPNVNPVTGALPSRVGRNVHVFLTRKGATPLTGQPSQLITIETRVSIPAGVESADFPALAAAMSFHQGLLWNQGQAWCDAQASGLL